MSINKLRPRSWSLSTKRIGIGVKPISKIHIFVQKRSGIVCINNIL